MDTQKKIYSWYFSKSALPYWSVLLLDSALIVLSGFVSHYYFLGGMYILQTFWPLLYFWICTLPLFYVGMRLFHTYSGIIRYSTFADLMRLTNALLVGYGLSGITVRILRSFDALPFTLSLQCFFISFFISLILMSSVRIIARSIYDTLSSSKDMQPVFVYGVKEGGLAIAKSIRNEEPRHYEVKGFVSDEPEFKGRYLMSVNIYAPDAHLIENMRKHEAKLLFVSPLCSEDFRNNTQLVDNLTQAGIKIMMLPASVSWDGKSRLNHQQLHEVDIEDLLPRDKIEVDMQAIGAMLHNKRILITGAAGSIGSEMVRQIAMYDPAELVLIDQAETPMHDVRLYMASKHPNTPCWTIVGSISNASHMEQIFEEHKPEYVFHAAAYKHVPMMEDNPAMAVQNNIYGTRVVADLAVKYGTHKFVMISTDKAVNPTNVMGCSKRICEIYCQSLNAKLAGQGTQFITTRFGNVLGSNGSVIPIFREQIRKGGPVTVTHPDIIRYFMLIPEACQLVLEAGTMGHGGEIFVFDMGKPVRIADLARKMIDLSGAKGVTIQYTGLRDGEKLYEEVLNDAERTKPTLHPKIKVAAVREYPYEQALAQEESLYELSFSYDDMAIVKKMKEIVPEYKSRQSKYEILDK